MAWIRPEPDPFTPLDTSSNHDEEVDNNDEYPKNEKLKESSSIDAEVIKAFKLRLNPLPRGTN